MVNISFGDFSDLGLIYCNIGLIFDARDILIFQTKFDIALKQELALIYIKDFSKVNIFDSKITN